MYLGLNIHSQVRSKTIIDQLNELCISISYDCVLQLESTFANYMCQQFEVDNIVCPSQLRKQLLTYVALDYVDRNSTSAGLFGCLYVANQQRDGDLGLFFRHEN